MSLKAFHIIFVTVSTILAAGFGLWALREFSATRDVAALLWGAGSLVGAVVLVVYGRWFLRKLSGVGYL